MSIRQQNMAGKNARVLNNRKREKGDNDRVLESNLLYLE